MNISTDNLKPVLTFLFSKDNYNIHDELKICLMKNFNELEKLFNVYLTRRKRDVYLWW
jgi:hypothetical protein